MSVGVELPPPPGALDRAGGGGGGWTELVTARDDIDAHLLIGRLTEAGIAARSVKDRRAAGAWLYGGSNPWAPVTVWVRRLQLDDARLVLAEISLDGAPDGGASPRPPEPPGDAGRAWRLPLTWWALAVALGVLLTLISLMQVAGLASTCGSDGDCSKRYDVPA
ncbi:hypothetical protein BH24ACT26_BH24ACT26_04680 [soil metagenome]